MVRRKKVTAPPNDQWLPEGVVCYRTRDIGNEAPVAGIKFLGWFDPSTMEKNPLNWRTHPVRQRQAYNALKENTGWLDVGLFNRATNHLLDGHMRLDECLKTGEEFPAFVGDWTEEQENRILASFDSITGMAVANADALKSLTEQNRKRFAETTDDISTKHKQHLQQLQQDLHNYAQDIQEGQAEDTFLRRSDTRIRLRAEPEDDPPVIPEDQEDPDIHREYLEVDVYFPSTNEYGFPDLDPNLLATPDMVPSITWDRTPETSSPEVLSQAYFCHSSRPYPEGRSGGTLGFFTEDWRFDYMWEMKWREDFANLLLQEDWNCVVEPDFSPWGDMPLIQRQWQVYRGRWCARYWQSLGIYIIPNLIAEHRTHMNTWAFAGVPTPCPVLAVQCRHINHHGATWDHFYKEMAIACDILNPEVLVIYGGGENQKYIAGYIPDGVKPVYLYSYTRQRMMKQKKKQQKKQVKVNDDNKVLSG